MQLAESPLSEVEELLIDANHALVGEECPECGEEVAAVDHHGGGVLYVAHTSDSISASSENDLGDLEGCRVSPNDAGL